jgi:hypothetical protein
LFSGSSKPVTIPEIVSKNRKRNTKKKEEEGFGGLNAGQLKLYEGNKERK